MQTLNFRDWMCSISSGLIFESNAVWRMAHVGILI